MYGNYSLFLQIAPISLHGDATAESLLLHICSDLGVSAKLNMEDIERYHIRPENYRKDGANEEFIYSGKEFLSLQGSEFSRIRNHINRFYKEGGRTQTGFELDIVDLSNAWSAVRGNGSQRLLTRSLLANRINPHLKINRVVTGVNTLEAFSVTESVAGSHVVIVQRLRSYNSTLNSINPIVQYTDFRQYSDLIYDKDVYFNIGSAVGLSGMLKSKSSLRPFKKMQIYRTEPYNKLNVAVVSAYFRQFKQ
jgi:hypothetical protein